ncbi:hypothetical protein EDM00_11425 [Ornithobacterium rhinotracheale]|uniref:outer membrane beta-barrel family protein n=1 Tax=Ornithobacterium rhinotracheale TaxID=28251 RepID=UPI00129C8ABE|nr:outer membrane beta-barrel family protein [Ornithobacterium rhinotracheale]MRI64589.1 hypothetical protein [Ornithobacterium rhinotracheale]
MKYFYIIIFFSPYLFAQNYKVTAKVVNDDYKYPIEFVNATMMVDDSIYNKTITNHEGIFVLNAKKGKYTLIIDQFGETLFKKEIEVFTDLDLGEIPIKESVKLKSLIINSNKPLIQQKVDRTIFNLENSIAGSNGTALDALRITPGIQVQNNKISIIGKQDIRILLNDRFVQFSGEELINYLNSLPSEDIKNIEVITAPPSKYEAEGNSGLINIILKNPKENSWSNQIRTNYIQTTYPAFKLGNTFNYNHNKLQFSVSIDAKKGDQQKLEKFQIFYPNGVWMDTIVAKEKKDFISGRIGIDYQITKKSSIGFLYSGNYRKPNRDENSLTQIYNHQSSIISKIKNNGDLKSSSSHNAFNFHFLQKLDDLGRKISVDLDYFAYTNNRDRMFSSKRTGNVINHMISRNTSNQDIKNYSSKIDVQHPFSWGEFNYGAKLTRTKTENNVNLFDLTSGVSIADLNQTDAFDYIEYIQALYIDFTKNFNEKWQTKLGVRLENTQTEGFSKTLNRNTERNYLEIFPTAYINYVKNENNIFNLSYSRRIDRPSFWELNPFKFYLNANSYAEGNPFLFPGIDDNIELKYIHKNKYITDIFMTHVKDGSGQVSKINTANNQQIYTQQNYYYGYVYGIRQTIIFNPFKWWNTTNMFAAFSSNMEAEKEVDFVSKMQNGWNFQVYSNQVFLLNEEGTLQAEATFMASSKGRNDVYETSPSAWLNLGIRMQLMDNNLQITAQVNDVFKSSIPNTTTYTSDIKQVYNIYNDNRYFTLGINYMFGNRKIRVRERNLGNKDELNRVN